MTLHLNDDQLDDLLIANTSTEPITDTSTDARAHLAACADCAARFAAVQSPLASFNAVSLAWSQRRSATLPLQLRPSSSSLTAGSRWRIAAGTAAAAIFALALALPLLHHGSATETAHQATLVQRTAQQTAQATASPESIPTTTAITQQPLTRDQQIASDNQLLQAIDHELAASETPSNLLKMASPQDSNQTSPGTTRND